MHPYIKPLQALLKKNGDSEAAVSMKKYMRDQFEFFGLKQDTRRTLCKNYMNAKPFPEGDELRTIVKELWVMPERDFQYFGVELLIKGKKQWLEKDIRLFEKLITTRSWWDTHDYLANQVVGPWFRKYPAHISKVTPKWNASANIWLQRMSILFQLKYKRHTDLELLFRHIRNLADSKEFFVQKAIGWSLREYTKTDPAPVLDFLENEKLAPLSRREAMKVLNRKEK